MVQAKPKIIEFDMDKLEDVLRRAEMKLGEEDFAMLKALADAYAYLTEVVGNKNTSIARLRKLLFGAKTEKTAMVVGRNLPDSAASAAVASEVPTTAATTIEAASGDAKADREAATDAQAEGQNTSFLEANTDSPASNPGPGKGHGRNGADAYTAAEKFEIRHPSLRPGDPCPTCGEGTVYETNRPRVLVCLKGQAPVGAEVYYLQKLRCNLCDELFIAEPPVGAGKEKYDATVGSTISLLKYGMGMPFNRNENLQASVGIPLPASTQWDIVAEHAERAEPAFEELIRQAAQGDVVHNDDTPAKILALMGKQDTALAQAPTDEQPVATALRTAPASADSVEVGAAAKKPEAQRTGIFTTGIVSIRGEQKIVLFLSGRQHAGENLADVLARRATDLPAPIQMCDALSRNMPGKLKTILSNCLAHGRRKFVDVVQEFPEECRHVLESLSVIYRNDTIAKERKLSPQERLLLHQADSGPVMEELHAWLGRQFDERRVEPNSALGGSIAYMLRHWEKLTLFLRVAGAPLDNNICERVLKMAIRHRRNSLFYKTPHGAHVGDIFMSLIHTCGFCRANPLEYLTEIDRHADEVASNPGDWMPWNYRQTLTATAVSPAAP
jgi:transposase